MWALCYPYPKVSLSLYPPWSQPQRGAQIAAGSGVGVTGPGPSGLRAGQGSEVRVANGTWLMSHFPRTDNEAGDNHGKQDPGTQGPDPGHCGGGALPDTPHAYVSRSLLGDQGPLAMDTGDRWLLSWEQWGGAWELGR